MGCRVLLGGGLEIPYMAFLGFYYIWEGFLWTLTDYHYCLCYEFYEVKKSHVGDFENTTKGHLTPYRVIPHL